VGCRRHDSLKSAGFEALLHFASCRSAANVNINAQCKSNKKENCRKSIHQRFIKRYISKFFNKKMNVRIAFVWVTQFLPDLPVPFCEKTKSKPIKNTKAKPGKRCQAKGYKIPFPQFSWNPSKKVEDDKQYVENEEEVISNFIEHEVLHNQR